MTEMTTISREELANLEERARKLAKEKSYLQLIVGMMQKLSAVPGLEKTIDGILHIVLDSVGGTNLIIYYLIDNEIYCADVFGKRMRLDGIEDTRVKQVFETHEIIEYEHEFQDTRMLTPEFTRAWTWVVPLMVGTEIIGVLRIENLHVEMREFQTYLPAFFKYAALILKNEILGQTRLKKAYDGLEQEMAVRKQAEKDLAETNEKLKLKLDSILSPDVEIGEQELGNFINAKDIQSIMDDFYRLTNMGIGIIDLKGNVLVGTGWQDVCTKFHRVNPESLKNCLESDLILTRNVPEGESFAYKCKNNMWDIATPIFIGGKHMGNIYFGQFFYEDEEPDYGAFIAQAEKYGFDKDEYLSAVRQVPRFSREKVECLMSFYAKFAGVLSKLGYSNLKLVRLTIENQRNVAELIRAKEGLEESVAERTTELRNANELLNKELEERRLAEEEILRLNRMYNVLSRTNEMIVRAQNRQSLFDEACKIAVDQGALLMAWIGMVDEETHFIKPVAMYGNFGDYLKDIRISMDDIPEGRGPTGTAMREGRHFICMDIEHEPYMEPWRNAALNMGYRSSAAFPLRVGDEVKGTYTVFARDVNWFTKDGVGLLDELAADISYALDYLEKEELRKKAEEKLRVASLYARSLIEASLDPLVTINPDGKITDVNLSTESVTGYHRSELIGSDFSDYFTEPDKARSGYQQVFRTGFVRNYELEIRHKDGHVTPVRYNASIYRDDAGKEIGVFAAARDITELKRAEDSLRKSEGRYRLLVESSPMCIHEIGLDGRISSMNRAGLVMMGVKEECDVQGFLYLDAVSDTDRERIGKLLEKAYSGEASYFEFKASGPSGRIFKSCFVPIMDQNDRVEKLMGITEDITERKRSEEAILEKEERLALATVHNGVGVWDWNLRTQKMIWDDSMYALYHIRREEFSGTEEAWRAALHPDDLARGDREVEDAISGKKPFDTEFRVVWPTGEIRYIKAVAKVFRDDQGTPLRMLGINMDISERKRAEEEIRRLNDELEQRVRRRTAELETANKELEAFSYSVSHDLRAPLRAISGFSQVIAEDYKDKLDDEGKKSLNYVVTNVLKMEQLIDDLLAFSRTGRKEMMHSEINMTELAASVFEEQKVINPGRSIKYDLKELPPAYGDSALMKQVFANLMSNALKFTRPREVAIIEVGGRIEEGDIIYYVKDNGVGFDMKYAEKLFGVFQRLHSSSDFEGTGVGLAIVHKIVSRHGGRIWAEGKENEGATFYFTLPKK